METKRPIKRKRVYKVYSEEEIQMIVSNYNHNISKFKNSKALENLLDRPYWSILDKMRLLERKGILTVSVSPVKKGASENFMFTVLNLALSRIDKEEKQKLIIKLMSEI